VDTLISQGLRLLDTSRGTLPAAVSLS